MQFLRTFFRTFLKSFSPAYTKDILAASFGFSVKFFLGFHVIAAVVIAVMVAIPVSHFDLSNVIQEGLKAVPPDLALTYDAGTLTINKPLPYAIDMPTSWREALQKSEAHNADSFKEPAVKHLVLFLSDDAFVLKDFRSYDAFVVVTESTVYAAQSNRGEVRAYPLQSEDGVYPPKQTVELREVVEMVNSAVLTHPFVVHRLYAPLIGAFVFAFALPGMNVYHMISLCIFALCVWLIVKLFMARSLPNLGFAKVYQVTMHTFVPIFLLDVITELTLKKDLLTPNLFCVVIVLITTLFLSQAHQGGEVVSAVSASLPSAKSVRGKRRS
jgi:hypothetical protein